jgi:hypothetical protein
MAFERKNKPPSPATLLEQRRKQILAEYRFYGLEPVRIAREPISMELALQLGLIVDTAAAVAEEVA